MIEFADLAGENLDLALPLLGAIAEPIAVDKQVVAGNTSELDDFAIAVAATVTLMFVTVLLVAGSLALEREENAFARITRGLVGPAGLLAEKVALGVVASFAVTLLLLAALTALVSIDWARTPMILLAILGGGAAFAAFGAAIGGAAKEVRASSLLAFMVSLPIAFLSLVPSGTVAAGVFDVIEVVRALFPFDPALDAMQGALDSAGPDLWLPLIHLGAIALAYGAARPSCGAAASAGSRGDRPLRPLPAGYLHGDGGASRPARGPAGARAAHPARPRGQAPGRQRARSVHRVGLGGRPPRRLRLRRRRRRARPGGVHDLLHRAGRASPGAHPASSPRTRASGRGRSPTSKRSRSCRRSRARPTAPSSASARALMPTAAATAASARAWAPTAPSPAIPR